MGEVLTLGQLSAQTGLRGAALTRALREGRFRVEVHEGLCPECSRFPARDTDPQGICSDCRSVLGEAHRGTCLVCVDPLLAAIHQAALALGLSEQRIARMLETGALAVRLGPPESFSG